MKIGFDAKRLFNNNTGLGNYSRTLVRDLATYYPTDEYSLYTPGISERVDTSYFTRGVDLKFEIRTARGLVPSLWRSHGLWTDVVKDQVDVYHGLSHDMPYGIGRVGRSATFGGHDVRRVVTMHDVCYKTYPDMFPFAERMIYDVKYKHACSVADKIIAISQSTCNDLVNLLGVPRDRIEVIYQAMNPVFYRDADEAACQAIREGYGVQGDYMLSVGAINSRKNLMGLLRAYALLTPSLRIPLVVVGTGGAYKDQCMKFAHKNGLTSSIIMLNNVGSSADLQALYHGATVLVYPSFYEGFGLPVTEALLTGTPVITSNISSLPEAGGQGACYIDPYTVEDIAQAMTQVLESSSLRNEMRQVGQRWAREEFDPQRLTARVHDLYQSLL